MCVWQAQNQGQTCLISHLTNCGQSGGLSLYEYYGAQIAIISHKDLDEEVE